MEKPMPKDPMPPDLTKRWIARFLDNIIPLAATLPIYILARMGIIPLAFNVAAAVIASLALFVYFVYMQKRYGQTLGKRHQKIKVCKLNGEPVGYQEVLLREMLIWAIGLYSLIAHTLHPGGNYNLADCLLAIDMLFAAVRSDNRALHDVIAGTKVVAAPEVVPADTGAAENV